MSKPALFDLACDNNCFLKSGVLAPIMDTAENWELVGHIAIDVRGGGFGWSYHIAPLIRHVNSGVSDRYYVADSSEAEIQSLESWTTGYDLGDKSALALFKASEIGSSTISPAFSPEKYNKTLDELRTAAENIDLSELKIAIFYRNFNLKGTSALLGIKAYLQLTNETSLGAMTQQMTTIRKQAFAQTPAEAKARLETYFPSVIEYLRTRSTGWGCFD